jgi:hypothetical protein
VTTTDRDKLLTALRESREAWLGSLEGCTNVTQRPEANRWSVLEIAEHVSIVENRLLGVIKSAPAGDPPLPVDEAREHAFGVTLSHRDERFNAPEIVQPAGKMQTLEEASAAFEAARAAILEYVASGVDLRQKTTRHLKFGDVSGYEMTLIMSSHSARHAKQVDEVRALVAGPDRKL